MKEGKVLPKSVPESGKELRREGYLWNENNRFPTVSHYLLNRPQVDFRLPACCNPMDQIRKGENRFERIPFVISSSTAS